MATVLPALVDKTLGLLLRLVAKLSTAAGRRERLFALGRQVGLHVLPVHFYSPVPDNWTLPDSTWDKRYDQIPGVDWRVAEQLALLADLGQFSAELADVPLGPNAGETYAWKNDALWPGDGMVYYAMIRRYRSKRIIEVGAGHSTLIASRAAVANGGTQIVCIEPFPRDFLRRRIDGLAELIERPVQEVPLDRFRELESGDILFIDSTHVCKIGSDVNYLLLEIVPRLRPGVIVHVHDIFLPWEVDRGWVKEKNIFWNEQYLLFAFLLFNSAFDILLVNQYLGRAQPREFEAAFPAIPREFAPGGGSLWMRRRDG